jgi:hypothetical protein
MPLGPYRASINEYINLILGGQAISLDLSTGYFGFAPHKREKPQWAPSHEVLPADATRQM